VVTDYERELAKVAADIAEPVNDAADVSRRVFRVYHRAGLTGRVSDLEAAFDAVDAAVAQLGPAEDLCLLRANLALKCHRLAEAVAALELLPALATRAEGHMVLGDVDAQLGDVASAREHYESALRLAEDDERDWGALVRLAGLLGDDSLYAEAGEGLTAKEMRTFAWISLQRGALALREGEIDVAGWHYDVADTAYSGYWLVERHRAELAMATGQFDNAVQRYLGLAADAGPERPEVLQALGNAYAAMGWDDDAEVWREQALSACLRWSARGHVQFDHHLADLRRGRAPLQPSP
jgi:tetratricopeptide (TPR) repeat protein